jgi:hypothetical protein
MKTGTWMAGKPGEIKHIGVHIPQFSIPARTTDKNWPDLVSKAKRYDTIKLSNEVFGLPVGAGGRPLSLRQVMLVCNQERLEFDKGFPDMDDPRRILYTVLGVDWSVTGSTESYTVLTVLGFDSLGKAYILYAQRLNGTDILDQVERVRQVYVQYKCSHLASDRGVGVLQGQLLQRSFGRNLVSMIQYVAAKVNLRYDVQGDFYSADRTLAIDTAVIKVKMGSGKIESPCWAVMETFWNDALHVFEEESHSGRRLYRKDEDAPDDFLHSLTFAFMAQMVHTGQFVYQDKDSGPDTTFTF